MASTKRVTGNYEIYVDEMIIHGNLQVDGTRTEVNTITVNEDETITGNLTVNGPLYAGGSKGTNGQVLTSTGTGVAWNSAGATLSAAGSDHSVQYNNSGTIAGDTNLNYYYSNGNVQVGNTLIANNAIITSLNNNDLALTADGTGTLFMKDTLKLQFQTGSTPANIASTIHLLANTPAGGGTGLYIVNSSGSDELISKTKATVLALIFS